MTFSKVVINFVNSLFWILHMIHPDANKEYGTLFSIVIVWVQVVDNCDNLALFDLS